MLMTHKDSSTPTEYTNQLEERLRRNIVVKNSSIFVRSIDRLPSTITFPLFMIVNESEYGSSGSHWIAIYISGECIKKHYKTKLMSFYVFADERKGIYFDSYAKYPLHPIIIDFMEKHTKSYERNDKQIQAVNSESCGRFCVMFLIECSRKLKLNQFISRFSSTNFFLNELLLIKYLSSSMSEKIMK